jgi:hypothetical protein
VNFGGGSAEIVAPGHGLENAQVPEAWKLERI